MSKPRPTIREKAAARDGGIGQLHTPGVIFHVTNFSWPDETVTTRPAPALGKRGWE